MADDATSIEALERRLAAAEDRATKAESALREGNIRHRLLTETWAQALWETDASGVVTNDSPSWRAYTGQTQEEWLGNGWLDAIHPDDRALAQQQWQHALATSQILNTEFRLRALGGSWRWTNVLAAPMHDAAGQTVKWLGLNIDIDDRKQAEAALRKGDAMLRTVFQSIDEGFLIHQIIRDEDGRPIDICMLEANPALTRLTGLGRDLIGKPQRALMPELEQVWIDTFDRVARSGVPERFESYNEPTGRWYGVYISQVIGRDDQVAVVYDDVTVRKRAEIATRGSEERQAFLLKLGDAVGQVGNSEQVREKACQLLAETLHADRVYYVEFFPDEGYGLVRGDYAVPGRASLAGKYPLEAFRTTYERVARGGAWVVPDVAVSDDVAAAEAEYYADQGVIAWTNVPLLKDGTLRAALCVVQSTPRHWTAQEIGVIEETAERLWSAIKQGRAETALRESEERFRQFGRASSDGLWIRDAETLRLEYASDAMEEIYGLSIAAMTADPLAWPALIVPEDREETFGYIDRVKAGESVVHEFRIQRPKDLQFRWIRSVGFPLKDNGQGITRIAGISSDVTEERLLTQHQDILLHELQHRVRNIMGVIRSIGNRSASGATTVEDYRQTMEGRMMALARVQALLTREANAGGSLRDIIESEVKVQAHHPHQFALVGPEIMLSPKAVEVLTMAFHELSTNALKYGAFSVPKGRLTVSWSQFEQRGTAWLGIDWVEAGAPPRQPSTRRGFGSELIEGRIPYELGGIGKVRIEPEGARCRMEFPLKFAESILETDAPMPTTTFGGTIDMSGAPGLSGRDVLVVEDDYYMAADTVAALRGAGAEVMGPCPTEEATLDLLAARLPTHAVLDLNLGGGGPRFRIAQVLKDKGVPFIFITGYDPDVIPPELADVPRLQKPAPFRSIVDAVSRL